MTNNDILRRLRFAFNMNDDTMMKLSSTPDKEVSREQICAWLKQDEDPDYVHMEDVELAIFLNNFITLKRGEREGPKPEPEKKLNNNIILRKLKIALNLQAEDILEILAIMDFRFGKSELSALFRKPGTRQYRFCNDQVLRNFINGLQKKYRNVK